MTLTLDPSLALHNPSTEKALDQCTLETMAATKVLRLLPSSTINASGATPSRPNDINGSRWVGHLSVGTITGTTPTLTATIEQSVDGANWITLATFTQLTGASSNSVQHLFAASATDYLRPLLPYVRVSYTVGGGSPVFNNLTISLYLDN